MKTWGRIAVAGLVLALCSCRTAYYDMMERVGKHKRDILKDRVVAARDDQQEAKAQFQTTLQRFKEVAGVEVEELEARYNQLQKEYDRCESKAEDVRDRVQSIQQVATDLFMEWDDEIREIQNPELKQKSAEKLKATRERYKKLVDAMKQAEAKMAPVLTAFKDNVLFLKHNLNAKAIASLEGTVVKIETDVTALIKDMEASIAEANAFVTSMAE
jgi:DNA repair exonuclease SbcCD ATPase subunit